MEAEERPAIANQDWRLQAVTTLAEDYHSPNGAVIKIGSPVEVVGFVKFGDQLIRIPVPTPAAIYLSLARKAGQGAASFLSEKFVGELLDSRGKKVLSHDVETQFFDALENLVACVVFSYTIVARPLDSSEIG